MNPSKRRKKAWKKVTVGHATVTLYRIQDEEYVNGWSYLLVWRTPTGRMRERFADEAAALKQARLRALELSEGRIEGASMSTGDRDQLAAARQLANGTPLLDALEQWAKGRELTGGNVLAACQAWGARNGKAHTRVKVADAVNEYLKAKKAAGKMIATYHKSTFDRIKADLGELFLDTVSTKQIDVWIAQWDHPVTRNTYRRRIVTLWRWCQDKGYLSREVRTEAERTDAAHEAAPTIGILNVPTWRRLLEHFRETHPELLPALVLAGFCGLRRSEIHAQTWEDITLERKILRVTNAKRGTPARRMVPLCDAAIEWLMLSNSRSGTICPSVEFKGKLQPALAIDGIRRIAREASPPFALPENAFRHSYITHAVAATGDIPRVSLDAGNSPKEINRHYRELVSEAEGKMWFESVPAIVGELLPMGKAANE